jgi:hypothetical protein
METKKEERLSWIGWLIIVVIVLIGVYVTYSKSGFSTYRIKALSVEGKKNNINIRVKNDDSGTKILGNYTIKTVYGNVTLKDGAKITVRKNLFPRVIRYRGRTYEKSEKKWLNNIYTENFLTNTLEANLSVFKYDKNTGLSNIGGFEFEISSFAIYLTGIDFYIKGKNKFIIDDVEIETPITGAVLSVESDEWILKDWSSMDHIGLSHENNLSLSIIGKDYSSGASSIYFKPEWKKVEKMRVGNVTNYRYINIDLVKSQIELNETIYELIRKVRGE